MSELGPDAQDLVDAGRTAFKPSEADRARVFGALLPKLGASLAPEIAASKISGQGIAMKVSFAIVGAGLIGGGAMLALPSESSSHGPPPKVVATVLEAIPTVAILPTTPSVAPSNEPTAFVGEVPAARVRAEDRLAEEVAILSRAGAALRGGQPAAALKALDEHQRRFPAGVLSQERRAARVQALCALGRTSEGLRELKRLERSAPQSPHVARAKKACDVDDRQVP